VIDEITIEGKLTNEGIDLAKRALRHFHTLEIPAEKAIRGGARVEREVCGFVGEGGAVFAREYQDPEDVARREDAFGPMQMVAQRPDMRPRSARRCKQRECLGRNATRSHGV
jgi:hypothetical protein